MFTDPQLEVFQRELALHYTDGKISDDPVISEYLQGMKKTLDPTGRDYIAMLNSGGVNAYAAWGNVIVLNLGLLTFVGSESELASVVAHEQAHVRLKHFHRLPDNTKGVNAVSALAFLVAVFSKSDDALRIFGGAHSLAVNQEFAVRRRYEREADQRAARVLAEHDEYGIEGLLHLLEKMNEHGPNALPEYMSTHPASDLRLAEARAYLRQFNKGEESSEETASSLDFWLVKELIHLQNKTPYFRGAIPADLADVVRNYRTLIAAGEGAQEAADELANTAADNWIVAHALAHFLSIKGDHGAAADVLDKALRVHPDKLPLYAELLEILAMQGNRKEATKILSKLPNDFRERYEIAKAEVKLWLALGDEFNYRLAVCRTLYLEGKLDNALLVVQQLKEAPEAQASLVAQGRLEQIEKQIESMKKLLKS